MLVREFILKPSKQHVVLIIAAMLLSLAAVIYAALPDWIKWIGAIILTGYGSYLLYSASLRDRQAIMRIQLTDQGWEVRRGDYKEQVDLLGDSTVTQCVCVLRFKSAKRYFPYSCVIFRDSLLSADEYRRLLVAVKMS